MTYQAITTYYVAPTNKRGARYVARNASGLRVFLPASCDALGIFDQHVRAAKALADKYGWRGAWFAGGLDGKGYCFVCADVPYPYHGAAFLTLGTSHEHAAVQL